MFLSRNFCMEKLLPREVTVSPPPKKKKKNIDILFKMHKTNTK